MDVQINKENDSFETTPNVGSCSSLLPLLLNDEGNSEFKNDQEVLKYVQENREYNLKIDEENLKIDEENVKINEENILKPDQLKNEIDIVDKVELSADTGGFVEIDASDLNPLLSQPNTDAVDVVKPQEPSDTACESDLNPPSDLARRSSEPFSTDIGATPTVVTITTATSTLVTREEPQVILFPLDDGVPPQLPLHYANVNAPSSSASINNHSLFLPPSSSNKNNNQLQPSNHDWQLIASSNQSYINNNMYPQALFYGHPVVGVRGPRHLSGNGNGPSGYGPARLRGGSHLGFAGGGSERELCSELTKDKIKRWSLAGGNPELGLLRVKLEDVQRELSELRSKHESKLNDYQILLNQLEFCRETKNQLETELKGSRTEIMRLKTDYDRLLQQKQLMDRQVIDLQLKLQRKQGELDEILVGRPTTSGENLTRKLIEEYEDIRLDREKLKDKCRNFEGECNDIRQTLIMAQEEARTMQIQYESELEAQRIKIESMEHRQMAVYQQLHKMAQDRDLLRTDREVLRQQWEESCANATRFQNILQKREEDLHILQRKHDGVLAEYHRVMSERDSVLKENERLSEEKSNLMKKFKSTESDRQALIDQLMTREVQIQNLQQERDDFRRKIVQKTNDEDMNMILERHQIGPQSVSSNNTTSLAVGGPMAVSPTSPVVNDVGSPAGAYAEQRSIASSEDEVAMITSRAQEEKIDEMRRRFDSLKDQFESSRQEIDSAKQQRDWALGERQRIVAERDSMRTMCDTLRRERDDAITKLAVAIRDTDELQRQKEQAERELKKMKDRLELDLKPKMTNQDVSPSHSRDSAIDTDMAEWEIETLELNMSGSQKNEDLGLELRGGRDDPIYGTTVPIYVKSIAKGSKLDSVLKVFDCIMQVNNIDVSNMDRRSVMDILKNSNAVKMVIKRRRLIGMKLISVPLDSSGDEDMGITFEDGVYVTKIKTSSLAAKAGNLAVGDRLVYVNDIPVQGKTAPEVHELVQNHKGCGLVLAVMKSPPVLSPMTPSASLPGSFLTNNQRTKPSSVSNGTPFNQNFAQIKPPPTLRDESAQTSSINDVATNGFSPPKKESLFDKVHDKFFGKSDKKATVRASASIPNDAVDNLVRSTAANTRWRVPYSGSERSAAANRFRASSVCSSVSSSTTAGSDRAGRGSSAEQQVLLQLDSILEASEKECINKGVAKVMNAEKGGSGGTWPKYRPSPVVLTGNNVTSTIVPNPKKVVERKSIFPSVLPQPGQLTTAEQTALNSNGANFLRQTGLGQQVKMRGPDVRPMSYHPAVSGPKYMNYNDIMIPNSPPGSPATRSSVDVPSPQPRYFDPALIGRPSSVQQARRAKVMSQYEPTSSYMPAGGQPAAMVMFRPNQLHVARATPVIPVQSRYQGRSGLSPLPPSSAGGGSSVEQDLDAQSVTSQSSGFSRTGLKHYYVPHTQRYSQSQTGRLSPSSSLATDYFSQTRLSQGEVRTVCIEKMSSHESLGIGIAQPTRDGHGVFVSCVSENSLAAKHGLQVGDQILEVCGVNLRLAPITSASSVLSVIRRFGRSDQITLRVQYNPQRYLKEAVNDYQLYSTSSTPRATPNSMAGSGFVKSFLSRESSTQSTNTQHSRELLSSADCSLPREPRFVFLKKETSDWGFTLVGGNAIGIFVEDLKADSSAACPDGLRDGDQILEFDGINFRKLTLEQALATLERPCDSTVSILTQHNETKYQRCKAGAGDSFYIRALVDRQAENIDELSFKSGDILRVDNTVFNGVSGLWRAWLVDQEGRERSCGIIPSKTKLEEEFLFKRSGSEISAGDGSSEGGGSRRGTIRRSLKFIRRSSRTNPSTNHQRTPSKESRDLQDTDTIIADELYQRVERVDEKKKRPVLILGALTEVFVAKLLEDYPRMFSQCVPECVKPDSIKRLEQNLQHNIYVDYRKRDKLFEITSVAAVKEIVDKGFHCILHVSLAAVERLHRLQIYPVVIFVKFKHSKQIKEISEDRMGGKQAKELLEIANRLETENHNLFSTIIQGTHNTNVKYICQQIACAVEHEQKKTLWVVSNETL